MTGASHTEGAQEDYPELSKEDEDRLWQLRLDGYKQHMQGEEGIRKAEKRVELLRGAKQLRDSPTLRKTKRRELKLRTEAVALRVGMSRREVYAVLQHPPVVYRANTVVYYTHPLGLRHGGLLDRFYILTLEFDEKGHLARWRWSRR